MTDNLLARIQALQQMTLVELQAEWERLMGTPTRVRHKESLRKRIAWRIQEAEYGGL